MKEINEELVKELDDDIGDVMNLLKFENKKNLPDMNKDKVTMGYNDLMEQVRGSMGTKAMPVIENQSSLDQAKEAKRRLLLRA